MFTSTCDNLDLEFTDCERTGVDKDGRHQNTWRETERKGKTERDGLHL